MVAYLSFNRDGYASHCREYKSYWQWVEERNEQHYTNNVMNGNDYDAKNIMHTIRLLEVSREIMINGKMTNKRPNRDELLNIKGGAFKYEQLIEMADKLLTEIESAEQLSDLPDEPNENIVLARLVSMRDTLYSGSENTHYKDNCIEYASVGRPKKNK
ncbi:MAG: hypothetical protein XXXJIFNMEKO3_03384 [Candidatus Erwinia impunctatus]|nr:hypothetical protein XXXJIFNMEKO_03384 [Culicoides impunctatus]